MNLREYIYQTGECLTHDTDVVTLRSDIYAISLDLIHKGSGPLPATEGIHYIFSDSSNMASLSFAGEGDELILMAGIVPYQGPYWPTMSNLEWAVKNFDITAEEMPRMGWPIENRLPDGLVTPCIVTLLMPGMIKLDDETITVLRGVRRDLACVWLASKFGM